MSPEQIIEMVKNGQTDSHWMVFRYSKTRSVLMLLYKLFFAGLLLGMSGAILIFSAKPLTHDNKVIAYPLLAIGIIGALVLIHHIYTMFFLGSNMIVLTETELIKSVRGKVHAWSYTDITNLQQVVTQMKNTMPTYSVEFRDTKTGKTLELARGREFGPSQDIFTVLKTKVNS